MVVSLSLSGKVALVTGSGRGIGKSIVQIFAQAGANVAVNDVDEVLIDDTVKQLRQLDVRAIGIQADVIRKVEVEKMVEKVVRELGGLDILVNNAGIAIRKPVSELLEEDWDRVIDVDLKSIFLCSQAAFKHMMEQECGRVINIASIMGITALPLRAAYCAAKGGVMALTRELALEGVNHGITVNAICPGWTETELTKDLFAQKDVSEFLLARIPMGRYGKPQDVAGAALFLASDFANYITGQALVVDGGYTTL